ncbi:hypothetical protein DFH11DRAFT_1542513 [Phellopilus nigrolimitatus]|nr:hypothetical protein DFH11DRAFT_1542513 [Phellopilus nigrolimitatus]
MSTTLLVGVRCAASRGPRFGVSSVRRLRSIYKLESHLSLAIEGAPSTEGSRMGPDSKIFGSSDTRLTISAVRGTLNLLSKSVQAIPFFGAELGALLDVGTSIVAQIEEIQQALEDERDLAFLACNLIMTIGEHLNDPNVNDASGLKGDLLIVQIAIAVKLEADQRPRVAKDVQTYIARRLLARAQKRGNLVRKILKYHDQRYVPASVKKLKKHIEEAEKRFVLKSCMHIRKANAELKADNMELKADNAKMLALVTGISTDVQAIKRAVSESASIVLPAMPMPTTYSATATTDPTSDQDQVMHRSSKFASPENYPPGTLDAHLPSITRQPTLGKRGRDSDVSPTTILSYSNNVSREDSGPSRKRHERSRSRSDTPDHVRQQHPSPTLHRAGAIRRLKRPRHSAGELGTFSSSNAEKSEDPEESARHEDSPGPQALQQNSRAGKVDHATFTFTAPHPGIPSDMMTEDAPPAYEASQFTTANLKAKITPGLEGPALTVVQGKAAVDPDFRFSLGGARLSHRRTIS